MTSYVYELKKCVSCQNEYLTSSLRSGNNFGSQYYTDGFVSGSMFEEAYITRCPRCNTFYWKSSLPTIELISERERINNKYGWSEDFSTFNLNYETLLANPIWTNLEQEQYIRVRAWWAHNHQYREEFQSKNPLDQVFLKNDSLNSTEFQISSEQKKNLMRVIELLDLQLEENRLMMAEIYRELGDFDKSKSLLDFEFSEDMKDAVSIMKKLCDDQISKVEVINYSKVI